MTGAFRAWAAAALMGAAAAVSAAPAERWIEVRTPHLTLVSHASEAATRAIGRSLERFIDALSSLTGIQGPAGDPITVMVFADERAFAPFRPRQNGQTLDLSGYFQRADDQDLIALSLSPRGTDQPYRVIFHEYAHALFAARAALWPLWLQEGLAELYSTLGTSNERVIVGVPILTHVRLLQEHRLVPLSDLFAVDRASPAYTDSDRSVMFYAESWALVHYLIAGDEGRHRAAFERFMARVSAGEPAEAAFAETMGLDEETLTGALRRYTAAARYGTVTLGLVRPFRSPGPRIRRLPDAEADVLLGSLLMRIGRGDQADEFFDRAGVLDPKAPRLEESRGFLALGRRQYDAAIAHLQAAIAQEPRNPLAHYYYAETLRRRVMEQDEPMVPDVARSMIEPLRTAIRLRPDFARAHYLLGYAQSVSGDDLDEGVRALETAIRLAPPNRAAMLTLAAVQLKRGDAASARTLAQALIDAPDTTTQIRDEARLIAGAAK